MKIKTYNKDVYSMIKREQSIYILEAFDSNGNLVCSGRTKNIIDFGRMYLELYYNGYNVVDKHLIIYD